MAQYKVKNNTCSRLYSQYQCAKRDYGNQCRLIGDSWGYEKTPLWVQLLCKKIDSDKWLILEEFMIESE